MGLEKTKKAFAELRHQWIWLRIESRVYWLLNNAPEDGESGDELFDILLLWTQRQRDRLLDTDQ